MTAHTPGPWEVVNRTGEGPEVLHKGRQVAAPSGDNEAQELANAKLIAAAPALLAALESFIDGVGRLPCGEMDRFGLSEDWLVGKAALAQAKGEVPDGEATQ